MKISKRIKKQKSTDQVVTHSHYLLYTDGSFRLPNCGAYAAVILKDEQVVSRISGYEFHTTISRMELQAIISGLENIPEGSHVTIYSDSQYAINSIRAWIRAWHRNNWMTSSGRPVANKDLMEKLHHLMSLYKLTPMWVRGHSGDKYNEECDSIAQSLTSAMVAKKILPDPQKEKEYQEKKKQLQQGILHTHSQQTIMPTIMPLVMPWSYGR